MSDTSSTDCITIAKVQNMKRKGERIPIVTAYDYTTACLADSAGIPMVLVGDSLGQVVLGYNSTIPVTMEDMLHHVKAVARGTQRGLVIADMPFMSYRVSMEESLRNAARMLQEGGAQAIKLEGGQTECQTVQRIVECGIPVMGHIGLTPQSVHQLGGYKVQGKTAAEARRLLQDALALEGAGVFALVLEMVPAPLAKLITERLHVPTIGIGAGADCDGQVQVFHDMMGLFRDFVPKHTRWYATLGDSAVEALQRYANDVRDGVFPTQEQSYPIDTTILQELIAE